MARPPPPIRFAGIRTGDTEQNMIRWMEHTLGFSQEVATVLYQGQLL